jgi:hypothetical protein
VKYLRFRQRVIGLFVVGLCLVTANLSAQGKYSFDLDVPAARSSFWKVEDVGMATRLTADLEIPELRRDSQWNSTFQVALGQGDRIVALIFIRDAGKDTLSVSVRATEGDKVLGQHSIDGWKPKKGDRFQVQMDWNVAGILAVTSNGQDRGRFRLEFVPHSVTIAASTGQLVGHSVSLIAK